MKFRRMKFVAAALLATQWLAATGAQQFGARAAPATLDSKDDQSTDFIGERNLQ
jgi:hypothetical protein